MSKKRRHSAIAQTIAIMAKNDLMLGVGMALGYVTILIPALTNKNAKEFIYLNDTEISWMGSLMPVSSFLGGIVSGPITEPFGRKYSMMIWSIPLVLSTIIFYTANQLWHLYIAIFLGGLTGGIIQAPVLAYVAEVTEPRLRGMLSATNVLTIFLGIFLQFVVGSVVDWRTAALIMGIAPLSAFFWLWFVPETPYWLLARNKSDRARQSLAWLRGWVALDDVEEEFEQIRAGYLEPVSNNKDTIEEPLKISIVDKYCTKSFLWPLGLVSFFYILPSFSGITTLITFAVVVFSTLRVSIPKYEATVLMGLAQFVGCFLCIFCIKYWGKRVTGVVSITGVCLCNIFVGIYAYLYDIVKLDFDVTDNTESELKYKWVPLFCLVSLAFIGNCGLKNLPYILSGEVFSNDTRSVGCGLSISFFFISYFLSARFLLATISFLTLPGLFWAYACMCAIGLLIVIFGLPETEGKTLEEIINHFNGTCKISNKTKTYSVE